MESEMLASAKGAVTLLLFVEFSWAKSSHFNGYPCDQEFFVRVNNFLETDSRW